MKTSLFDFHLPESLIATQPAEPRDSARMLVVWDGLKHAGVADFPSFLKPNDIVVFNDTRVIPARLFGRRGEAKIEILLHKNMGNGQWSCFAKPAKKLKSSDEVSFADDFSASVVEKQQDGQVVLQFTFPSPLEGEGQGGGCDNVSNIGGPTPPPNPLHQGEGVFFAMLAKYGHMPLPPYIKRDDNAADKERYQTVYAREEGSVAAPTAGLHFTPALLAAIDKLGVKRAHVTLHVGGGTFLPVKADDTDEHVMHSEYAEISKGTADAINAAKKSGGRVIAVGTTSLRTLESAADDNGMVHPFARETNIFITPGYKFKAVDMLLTNFHLPKSTLFMLVSAFAGLEKMKTAYEEAVSKNYRFYSYGDACLLYRNLS